MHDEVSEVQQYPAPFGPALAAQRLEVEFAQFCFDFFTDRKYLALIASAREEEYFRKRQRKRNVEGYEVLRLLRVCRGGGLLHGSERPCGYRHDSPVEILRVIGTCQKILKIIPAAKSRMTPIPMAAPVIDSPIMSLLPLGRRAIRTL